MLMVCVYAALTNDVVFHWEWVSKDHFMPARIEVMGGGGGGGGGGTQ